MTTTFVLVTGAWHGGWAWRGVAQELPHPFQYFDHPVAPLDPQALGVEASYVISREDISMPPGEWGFSPVRRPPRRHPAHDAGQP